MKPETAQKLLNINRQFYQTFAREFDTTRQRVQPGVGRVLELIPSHVRILELGCGNGQVARELARRGFAGRYVGVDFSESLVEKAKKGIEGREAGRKKWEFRVADLTAADWDAGLGGPFDVVLAFAVLHHLPPVFYPGILRKVHSLLAHPLSPGQTSHFSLPASYFFLSNWQFLNSPRWRARVQPWERAGLRPEDVGPEDYLLDWRRGGEGLRYVHHFSEAELATLAEGAGFEVVKVFYSDGAERNLGLYQIWRPL